MHNIELKLNQAGRGAFVVEENGERLAEMTIGLVKNDMVIFHTKVEDKLAGQGIAKQLLTKAVTYVREHQLKIIPLCPFVRSQFEKYPDEYADIWNKHYKA